MSPSSVPNVPGSSGELTPEWKELLYAPARVERWVRGEITLEQLSHVSGEELLELAASGHAAFEAGRFAEARAIFRGLAALAPDEPYHRTALAAVALAEGDLETAERQLDEAIRLNEHEVAAYLNRGELYLRQGRVREATEALHRAIALSADDRDPLTLRARALAEAALEKLG